jgi:uncharacterized protein (TIGR04255 family)
MMDAPAPPAKPLNVPPAGAAHFSKNFIRLAVCELRFPTLFELEAERPPLGFAKAVRKEYPLYNPLKNVNLNPLAQSNVHSFRSKKGRWTVTLRAAALSLETSNYDTFSEFEERLGFVLKAAEGTIDSDFFTRVGLRYINAMPFAPSEVKQWVNPALVSPLGEGTFGDVEEHWQRVRGPTTVGGYFFQHGLDTNPQAGRREYVLDFDFYREDVTIPETLSIVRQLHEQEYAMFAWSLGDKAKEHLGPSTLKE